MHIHTCIHAFPVPGTDMENATEYPDGIDRIIEGHTRYSLRTFEQKHNLKHNNSVTHYYCILWTCTTFSKSKGGDSLCKGSIKTFCKEYPVLDFVIIEKIELVFLLSNFYQSWFYFSIQGLKVNRCPPTNYRQDTPPRLWSRPWLWLESNPRKEGNSMFKVQGFTTTAAVVVSPRSLQDQGTGKDQRMEDGPDQWLDLLLLSRALSQVHRPADSSPEVITDEQTSSSPEPKSWEDGSCPLLSLSRWCRAYSVLWSGKGDERCCMRITNRPCAVEA